MQSNVIYATTTPMHLMLQDISNGKTQLPDFQREWRWKDQQIKSLLASVSIGIPIGALLTLEGDEQLAPRPFAGVEGNPSPNTATMLILDGQQRLTALYQACYSQTPVAITARKSVTEKEYYFDVNKCLEDDIDRENCIISENPDGPHLDPEAQYQDEIFPTSAMFNFRDWRDGYLEHHQRAESKKITINRFEDVVVRNFDRYELPTIRMVGSDLEAVCITFEKTNDRGIRLDAFEIITAKLKREDFNLKEDWSEQRAILDLEPVLGRVAETHYLKALTLLATQADQTRASARRKDMLGLNRQRYEAYNKATTEGFIKAAKQLRQFGITTAKDLTHLPHAIVMAAVYAQSGNRADTIRARNNFKRWYWTTALNESYGSRVTDMQIATDFLELVKGLTTPAREPLTFSGRPFNSARLAHDRQKTLTVAIQNMLAKENHTSDWITGRPMDVDEGTKSDMHHIFPKKWCNQNGIADEYRESIANLTLIDSATNNIIGGRAPSLYLPDLQERAGISDQEMDLILESHLIPAGAMRQDDFKTFHETRAKNLRNMVAEVIGEDRVT